MSNEKIMLLKAGWKKDSIEENTPALPISAWMGHIFLKASDNMGWLKGQDNEGR